MILGNTNIGASDNWRSANALIGRTIQSLEPGTVTKIRAYVKEDRSGALNIKGVITDSSGNILTNGVSAAALVGASYGWIDLIFTTPPAIIAGDYILWIIADSGTSNLAIAYDADAVNNPCRVDTSNNFTTPTDPTDMIAPQSLNLSIYTEIEVWTKQAKDDGSGWTKTPKN